MLLIGLAGFGEGGEREILPPQLGEGRPRHRGKNYRGELTGSSFLVLTEIPFRLFDRPRHRGDQILLLEYIYSFRKRLTLFF